MPPPSNHRADVEPPEEITWVAAQGFLTGALRFGSVSILAHMILILPHPFVFSAPSPPVAYAPTQPRPRPNIFSRDYLRSRLFHRPIEGFSSWISPGSRVYRGLTPQFKVFLQVVAMTLGGCIWQEKRVTEYIELLRRIKRTERLEAERAGGHRR
ncbi:uncharacterized protein N7518_009468 [Penicillium psychrosexuale]|uniref:uncharacterized protein n=1 Tax=Penicillium psychrosexuale TaxID=1002107 RepID=UPI0025456831|nr:uncharacterized protein N7518_009468 [Penicillium psychrosexuale]KAI2696460.1 hypothetical protein CBS147332_9027 [Penicillium roqueforti]KAI3096291.1 hypothetical protein CBS147331_9235 [Penicillium roqueforti]KAJ5783791.1 hypothetical protein N7518_009468 [Penicillium psychrosexuale]